MPTTSKKWAEFRFSIIGHLLASPPGHGELQKVLQELSLRSWKHPGTGENVNFSFSTLERWYYLSLKENGSPINSLLKKTRSDNNTVNHHNPTS